jgi:DNA-binding GntR family transcriptional regulator
MERAGRSPVAHSRPSFERRTLQHNVYDYLCEALMSGEYAPGERLTVRGVAAAAGTSVMPVREAFRRLTSEGAFEPLSTGATRVPMFDLPKLQDLIEIRLTVEGLAARRAAERLPAEEYRLLEQLNHVILKAAADGDRAGAARANERFHFGIYRAAQSAELLRIIEHLWLQVGPYLAWLLKQRGPWARRLEGARAFRHHKDILDALRRHDAQRAEVAMRADLMISAEIFFEGAGQLPGLSSR